MTFRSRVQQSAPVLLVVSTLCFLGLAWLAVPRLTNCLWSDVEFTGWIGPIAERLVDGDRIYRDFTLPISPGSFLLISAVQRLTGQSHVVHELWLIALCQLGMVWVSYWLLCPFVARPVAALAAAATAPILIMAPKELAYDQTAQLVAWSSLAALAHALSARAERRRLRLLFVAGLLSSLVLLFKSSTGVGSVGGTLLGLGLITAIAWHREGTAGARSLRREWAALGMGIAAGAVTLAATILAIGGSLVEFWRVVFVDGPALKGGTKAALLNLLSFVSVQVPMALSLLALALLTYVLIRHGQRQLPLHLLISNARPADPSRDRESGAWRLPVAAALIVAAYATAMVLLWQGAARVPVPLRFVGEYSPHATMAGLLMVVALSVASVHGAEHARDRRAIFAAIALAAVIQSLAHNLSVPRLRLFADNNVVIPLAVGALLHVLHRARTTVLQYLVFALLLTGLFRAKYQRFLDARHPVTEPGFWQGMQVSQRGQTILRAAVRARELAGPSGSVLVLPEDPMLVALIDRPRPRLFGAVVFVDQLPARALERELDALWNEPPDVLVLHPRNPRQWKAFNRLWQAESPAEQLQDEFVAAHLESHYRRDSSYESWFFKHPAMLDIHVRTAPRETGSP